MKIIPVANKNDSVSYTEFESEDRLFGDNDMLSVVVAVLCRAKKLIILSDINGFYNNDPRLYPKAKLIECITKIDGNILSLAGDASSRRGTGGMKTKVQAAEMVTVPGSFINKIISIWYFNLCNKNAILEIYLKYKIGVKTFCLNACIVTMSILVKADRT